MTDIIDAPRREYAPLRYHVTGLHRGANASVATLGELSKNSLRAFEGKAIDAVPGRPVTYRDDAKKHGLAIEPIEARVEDLMDDAGFDAPDLHVLHVDDPETVRRAVLHARHHGYALTGLLLLRLPRLGLVAFRFAASPGDPASYDRVEHFARATSQVTSNAGSERFWSNDAPRSFRRTEPALRRWYDNHLETRVPTLLAGGRRRGTVIEATSDGRTTRPVVLLESDRFDANPNAVAERVAAAADFPLRRGTPFTAIELAKEPEATLRVRHGRIRSDHLLQVGGASDVTRRDLREQADLELAASRRRGGAPSGDFGAAALGLALGFALGAALAGQVTKQSPLDLTD